MNPEEDIVVDDSLLDLDPMPGDDEEMAAPPEGQMPEDTGEGIDPETRARLIESMVLEDPNMRQVYLAGLQAQQAGQQAQQAPDQPQGPELDMDYIQGDPALENMAAFFMSKINALERERDQAKMEAQMAQQDQAFIAALAQKAGADPGVFAEVQQIPGLAAAAQQHPQLAAFLEKAGRALATNDRKQALGQKGVQPPASIADAADYGDAGSVNQRAKELKSQHSGQSGYKGFTDADWKRYAKDEIAMEKGKK